jgi:signal transduction histidine kinase/ligand-binding sensor domain-containing protein/DNA-binding response OmpR family regulator
MRIPFFSKFIFCLIAIIAINFSAQSQKLKFEHFTVEEGLQNNIVLATTQDEKGFMWFATVTGIDRFDGNKFVHYKLPSKNNTQSEFLQILFLDITTNKTLWAASLNSVFTYNVKLDKFENATVVNSKMQPSQTITSLLADANGSLWVGLSNGLLVYKQKTNSVIEIPSFQLPIKALFQDDKNIIWVATNKGIFSFIEKNGTMNKIEIDGAIKTEVSNPNVNIISQDKRNRYWLATGDKGLLVFDNNSITTIKLPQPANRPYTIKDIYHDNNAQTYISLDGGGLILIDEKLKVKSISQTNEDAPTTLSNNGVYDIFEDKYNRIWVTTYGGGVNLLNTIAQPFTNLSHEINNNNSLSNNMAKAVTEDKLGNLWFGTRKGVSKFNISANNWKHFNEETNAPTYTTDNVLAITCDSDNEIWTGTFGGGLVKISENGNVLAYTKNGADSTSIGSDFVYAVLADSKKRIWCGGIRGPLSIFDKTTKKFKRIALNVTNINCIIEDTYGDILVGTEKGVFIIYDNYHVSKINLNFPGKTNFITDKVMSILEYKPGEIWIGTLGGGVIIANKKGNIVKIYRTNDGLSSDIICSMQKDVNGDVWMSTSSGITHYQSDLKTFTTYAKADGLAASQFNYGSGFYTKNGNLIFGSTNGYSIFNPLTIKVNGYKPNIYFTGISINNKPVTASDEASPINEQIDELKRIYLKYFQNSFAIDFISTSPAISGKHLYSWKLEGFDKDWSPLSSFSTAIYTNLNSGKYTLLVKAFAKGQKTNDSEIRRIEILIKSPWWKSVWAYLIYILLAAASIYGIYNFYEIKRAKKNYADRLKLNTSISHEIRTPLTLIKGPVTALAESEGLTEDDKSNMHLAIKNIEKLERIITQFIEYQKSGFQKLQMQVVQEDILLLLDDVVNSFQPLVKEKNLQFIYQRPEEKMEILFDKDKMEKIFNNLISNAVKYTPNDKQVTVSIQKDSKYLIINVADTGIGIPEEQQKYLFKEYFRADNTLNLNVVGSGVGLNFTKELVDRHHGKLSFVSEKGKGSTFTVKLLLNNLALEPHRVKNTFGNYEQIIPEINNEYEISSSANKKILIAEDNDMLRLYLEKILLRVNYQVYKAENGKQAYEILKKEKIDIIITDVMMPEMNGFQLCTAVKNEIETCHIPVIMLTAIHDKDYLVEGYRCGADDYVKKPYEMKYLITRIENLLQNRIRLRSKLMRIFEHEELAEKEDTDVIWLKEVTTIIADNITETSFSVEKLCSQMAMSQSAFFRKFKRITDDSPQKYIIQIRLRRSVELLKKGSFNIAEIAFECGFGDPKYFSTAFKKYFGKSPREYLQSIKTETEN